MPTTSLLDDARALLNASIDEAKTLSSLVDLVTRDLADACVIDLVRTDGSVRRAATGHRDPAKRALIARLGEFAPRHTRPIGPTAVIAQGRTLVEPDAAPETIREVSQSEEHLALVREIGPRSWVSMPLRSDGRLLGVVTAIWCSRRLEADEVERLEELGQMASVALGHALAHQQVQATARRMKQLQSITSRLLSTAGFVQAKRTVMTQVVSLLEADGAALTLASADGRSLEVVAATGYPDDLLTPLMSFSIDAELAATAAFKTGKPQIFHRVEKLVECFPAGAPVVLPSGHQSFVYLPMVLDQRRIGTLGVTAQRPYAFEDADEEFFTLLGQACAMALDRAKLFDAEREARAEAEANGRMMDEFLATMSHELRTPLNAVLGWASMLRGGQVPEGGDLRALETIERNARVQARLIDDLLDVSRIHSGKLRLEPQAVDLAQVAQASLDAVRPAAEAKAISLEAHIDRVDLLVADATRLQQIVWNLLSNAVKFTPREGRVTLSLVERGDSVEVEVADNGQGIARSFLPHVFDRFRQADSSTTRKHGGLGLGLAIVRHLVELHGGTVHAESEGEGKGARFLVTLPRNRATPLPPAPG